MEKIMEAPHIYLVEELELRVSIEAVEYQRKLSEFWQDNTFDPQYFKRFMEGPLLNEFVQTIYKRTQHLNNNEINKYLTVSLSQFKTHNPQLRFEAMKEQFWNDYWGSNDMGHYSRMNEYDAKYFTHVFKWYERHFHLFEEAAKQALEDFKKGYLGSFADFAAQSTMQPKQKLKTNLTVKEIAYLFRALHEEGIIESRQKTDMFNFIAENFSSKQKDEISANSIKNAFDTPDFNAVDFWQEKFTHFMQKAKKDKEK